MFKAQESAKKKWGLIMIYIGLRGERDDEEQEFTWVLDSHSHILPSVMNLHLI